MEVIVLLDDEHRKSNFLHGLGQGEPAPGLCRQVTPDELRIYRYETFGLYTQSSNLDDFIASRDGIILIFRSSQDLKILRERITQIVRRAISVPTMFIIEHVGPGDLSPEYLCLMDEFTQIATRMTFVIDYRWPDWRNSIKTAHDWFVYALKSRDPSAKLSHDLVTSRSIKIGEMVEQFESCTLPLRLWDHYGRLRIVNYYLAKYGFERTVDPDGDLCRYWRAYKTSVGHGDLWHYTLTRFWATLLYLSSMKNQHCFTFQELWEACPELHSGSLHKEYYTQHALFTPQARFSWIAPDLKRLE